MPAAYAPKQKQPHSSPVRSPAHPARSALSPARIGDQQPAGHSLAGNQAGQHFAQSCPLARPSPTSCPLGGVCHSCPVRVQAKLKIGEPNDKYEQEADRVADQIMRMPEPETWEDGAGSGLNSNVHIQRACTECDDELRRKPLEEEEEDEILQAKEMPGQASDATPDLAGQINKLRERGEPLPPDSRSFFESRFGHDLRDVRVHADVQAAQLAHNLNARAFTLGQNVVFGVSQYAPDTNRGRWLLAHELTHVVQQNRNTLNAPRSLIQLEQAQPSANAPCINPLFYGHLDVVGPDIYFRNEREMGAREWRRQMEADRQGRCSIEISRRIPINDRGNTVTLNVHLLYGLNGTCCECFRGRVAWDLTIDPPGGDPYPVRQEEQLGNCAGEACCSIGRTLRISTTVLLHDLSGTVTIAGSTHRNRANAI